MCLNIIIICINVISLRRGGSEGRVETVPTSPTFYLRIWKLQQQKNKLAKLILFFHFQCIFYIRWLFNSPKPF